MTWRITFARARTVPHRARPLFAAAARRTGSDRGEQDHTFASHVLEADGGALRSPVGAETVDPLDLMLIRTAFVEKLSYSELALRTGLSPVTVRMRVRQALRTLARDFPAEGC